MRCALALLTALLLPACIPGGGGSDDDPLPLDGGVEPDPDPEPDPGPDPEPDPSPDPEPDPDPKPATCAEAAAEWPTAWTAFEDEVVERVNARRAAGADCGSEGSFAPVPALRSDEQLRCAARLHSRDMGERDYFDHFDPEGKDPFERIQAAAYTGFPGGENIAAGARTPAEVVSGWMDSDGHCANIMRRQFSEIGVGYAEVAGSEWRIYWTQTFGSR